ncbi:hypothetical protein D3C76_1206220 [compost metagenome]
MVEFVIVSGNGGGGSEPTDPVHSRRKLVIHFTGLEIAVGVHAGTVVTYPGAYTKIRFGPDLRQGSKKRSNIKRDNPPFTIAKCRNPFNGTED